MASKALSTQETELLRDILSSRRPSLLPLLAFLGLVPLTDKQREEIRGAVAEELIETGLTEEDEPNEKGLLLDDLIGRIGEL